ncbi:MAG: S8 family serine peptidase [Thermoleophilaceae bacterium]
MRRLGAAAAALASLAFAASPAVGAGDPLRGQQWGLDMIHADQAHATSIGAGAVVAMIDTGVAAGHPDLAGQTVAGYDFVDGDTTPQDGNGHGTHVSGIVAAAAGNGVGVDSVAPGARIMPVRVLDDGGNGSADVVAQGIDWAVAHGANVINLSLSDSVPIGAIGVRSAVDDAIDRAVAAGVVVAAAAGNSGLPVCEQPSAAKVLCVGAVDKRGARSFYSSFGDGLAVTAPGGSSLPMAGEDILSTWNDGGYQELAGTSQATPHVSGVAALLVSLGVRGQAAVNRILATAHDAGSPGPDSEYGAGIVDAAAAVSGLGRGGAGGSAGGSGSTTSARISVRRVLSIRSVLRHGIPVRCTAPGSGRCAVTARARGKKLARGSRAVQLGQPVLVRARVTRAGKGTLERVRSRVRVTLKVSFPGGTVTRRITLKR